LIAPLTLVYRRGEARSIVTDFIEISEQGLKPPRATTARPPSSEAGNGSRAKNESKKAKVSAASKGKRI